MRIRVLRDFPYAANGFTIRILHADNEENIHDDLIPGLVAEEFVEILKAEPSESVLSLSDNPPVADASEPDAYDVDQDGALDSSSERLRTAEPRAKQLAVDIPDNWRDLPYPTLRSLAARVSNDPVKTRDDCETAVEAELARRESYDLTD